MFILFDSLQSSCNILHPFNNICQCIFDSYDERWSWSYIRFEPNSWTNSIIDKPQPNLLRYFYIRQEGTNIWEVFVINKYIKEYLNFDISQYKKKYIEPLYIWDET
jgi:hypothetical protein